MAKLMMPFEAFGKIFIENSCLFIIMVLMPKSAGVLAKTKVIEDRV